MCFYKLELPVQKLSSVNKYGIDNANLSRIVTDGGVPGKIKDLLPVFPYIIHGFTALDAYKELRRHIYKMAAEAYRKLGNHSGMHIRRGMGGRHQIKHQFLEIYPSRKFHKISDHLHIELQHECKDPAVRHVQGIGDHVVKKDFQVVLVPLCGLITVYDPQYLHGDLYVFYDPADIIKILIPVMI